MELLKYTYIRPREAQNPILRSVGGAAYELVVSRSVVLDPGTFSWLPTNLTIAIPPNYYGMIIGASSVMYRRGVLIMPVVIESSYRGEVQAQAVNTSNKRVSVMEGERIFWLMLHPIVDVQMTEVNTLPEGVKRS